ncbi:Metallothionein expression activator [Rhizina undulata]
MPPSPTKKIRRITNSSDNPPESKDDNKHLLQRHAKVLAPYPLPSKQRGEYSRQHRRNLSVPDDALMLGSAMSPNARHNNGNLFSPRPLDLNLSAFGIDSTDGRQARQHMRSNDSNFYTTTQFMQRPMTPPKQHVGKHQPVTPRSPFHTFSQAAQNAPHDLIAEILSNHQPRNSANARAEPSASFRSKGFYFPDTLMTPPHSAPLQQISTFDLAPLPHPNFVNLAALAMGTESDFERESYYSPAPSAISPPLSGHSSPELKQLQTFETSMTTISEYAPAMSSVPIMDPPKLDPDLPGNSLPQSPSPEHVGEAYERSEDQFSMKATGITMEEISSYIAGPEPSDSKWVCLYPDCSKRFGRKENIKSHVQTHLGDRQYKCQVCRKCFVRQHDLKRHSKIHTGVKPYPCRCGNSFARHDALTRHRQRGMCIGAFEGIVKKVAKRGRPRKKPLRDGMAAENDDTPPPSSGRELSCSSDTSNPQTPHEGQDSGGRLSQDPEPDEMAQFSFREGSPGLPPASAADSPGYTPPSSPPEVYDFNEGLGQPRNRNSTVSVSSTVPDRDELPISYIPLNSSEHPGPLKKFGNNYNINDDFGSSLGEDDFGLFPQEGMDFLAGLTTLERDPSILNFEDIYVKPELLDTPVFGNT